MTETKQQILQTCDAISYNGTLVDNNETFKTMPQNIFYQFSAY